MHYVVYVYTEVIFFFLILAIVNTDYILFIHTSHKSVATTNIKTESINNILKLQQNINFTS